MILTAHQPVYLPWLGLFHKAALADSFVSFNQVQYLPKDWNNRNKIKTPNGPIWLTVPVLTSGHREKPLSEIEISNDVPWQRKHWKSISLSYKNAPYFSRYAPFLEDVYQRKWSRLAELNDHMLRYFLEALGIQVEFLDASEFQFQGKKSELVLDMCRQLKADVYIFGEMGKDYADVESFKRDGVRPVFQKYEHPTYPQLHGDFVPYLSIIDLLFMCGEKSRDIVMQGNLSRGELQGAGATQP